VQWTQVDTVCAGIGRLALLLALTHSAQAATILEEGFESQGRWQEQIRGKGSIERAPGGVEGKCLKTTSEDCALVYYSQPLPRDRVQGKRLIIRAKVKLENVIKGDQDYSTAKLHVGFRVGNEPGNRAQRFVGTTDWHDEVLVAEIPAEATQVVLDLGIQNGTGSAYFDNLVVDDGVREHTAVSLESVANASFRDEVAGDGEGGFLDAGPLDLRDLPVGDVRLGGVDFYILPPSENYGRTCVVLRGAKRPDRPARIDTVITVSKKASRLFFLHAAAWPSPAHSDPCLVYAIHYEGGAVVEVPLREGVDLGGLDAPRDLPNWKVAWSGKYAGGTVGLGVTTWENPNPGTPIAFVRLSTPGTGGVPVVVAVSLDPKGT